MEKSLENSVTEVDSATGVPATPNRKRVSRACDECRLHKSRCDGTTSCATCAQTGRECSYTLLPRDTKGPNAKVKILQRRLFKAQQFIIDLQKKQSLGKEPVDNSFHQLSDPESISTTAEPAFNPFSDTDCGENDVFSLPLIRSLLRSVSDNNNITSLLTSDAARFILCGPLGSQESTIQTFCQLMPYSTMLDIVYAAFSNVFTLFALVPEQDFRIRTQRLYYVSPIAYEPHDTAFMPLFFSVIALGMVYSSNLHANVGYLQILRESESYSRAAMATIPAGREYESHTQLQIALCRVLYLLNTSRADLANPALQTVCRSFMVQQLIRHVSAQEPEHVDLSNLSSRNIVWTVFYLDMHISSLSNVAPFLRKPKPEMATVYAINKAIHNVVNCRRSEADFLLSVSVAMAIELIKLTQSMPYSLERPQSPSVQKSASQGKARIQNSLTRDEVKTQCETWELLLQTAFTNDECNPTLLMVRRQLQMHLHLSQITLHHLSLGSRSQALPWNHVPSANEFNGEAACIEAAVNAVKYTSSYLAQDQVNIIPWHSAYILFISTITLLTAATSMSPSEQESTQDVINIALMILTTATYGSSYAKSCYLQFIQTLSDILKPPSSSKAPTTTSSNKTRRSSFSSDASTLISLNDGLTPFFTYSSAYSIPATVGDIPFRNPRVGVQGTSRTIGVESMGNSMSNETNLASEWGFD